MSDHYEMQIGDLKDQILELEKDKKKLIKCVKKARKTFKEMDIWDSLTDGCGEDGCFLSKTLKSID